MHPLLFLFLLGSIASAQTDASKLFGLGLKQAVSGLKPLPASEQKEVLGAVAALISKHVTFRSDGVAAATYHQTSPWPIEWRKLAVNGIHPQALSDADRLNGITRRYYASLGCDASRNWKPQSTAWSEWSPTGFVLFPSVIVVEEKNGVLSAKGNTELPKFFPGPGSSSIEKVQGDRSNPLPPGMTRGR